MSRRPNRYILAGPAWNAYPVLTLKTAYPGAGIRFNQSKGYEIWTVEVGQDLATRRSLRGFWHDGTTYELRFAWDAPIDELDQAVVWFGDLADTFGKAR